MARGPHDKSVIRFLWKHLRWLFKRGISKHNASDLIFIKRSWDLYVYRDNKAFQYYETIYCTLKRLTTM